MGAWDWLPSVVTIGATLFGAYEGNKTAQQNKQTAQTAITGATNAQERGIEAAKANAANLQGQASAGLIQEQNVMGRADKLTPAQQIGLDDATRTELDALQGGNLRGSARATVAAVDDVRNRGYEADLQANQQRADAAGAALSGQYFNAGNNINNLNLQAGNVASAGLISNASAGINTNSNQNTITGQAIGNIGSVISNGIKQQNTNANDITWNPAPATSSPTDSSGWNTPQYIDLSDVGSNQPIKVGGQGGGA